MAKAHSVNTPVPIAGSGNGILSPWIAAEFLAVHPDTRIPEEVVL